MYKVALLHNIYNDKNNKKITGQCHLNNKEINNNINIDKAKQSTTDSFVIRVLRKEFIFPGNSLVLGVESELLEGEEIVIEPRHLSRTVRETGWPPGQVVTVSKNKKIVVTNRTSDIIPVYKNDHICQMFQTTDAKIRSVSEITPKQDPVVESERPFNRYVKLDPQERLSASLRKEFAALHLRHDEVFAPTIGRYNDKSGKVRFRINIGSAKPPTRKLHVPNYGKNNLDELQRKFDELEAQGVFVRPEEVGVAVEHVSPSFLVAKSSGGHRLVTAFTSLVPYCKTLPTTLPTVDSVLRTIGSWECIIVTDLRDAFYQIQMDHDSMKWCATPTPYRGLRCYAVAVQGCPGSSEALEELLCAVMGDLVQEGIACKIADDLNVGASTPSMLLHNWSRVLERLEENNLRLKAPKTVIYPSHVQILGWDWCLGEISASSHKISPLTSCEPPETVTQLRSFIGAYKVFNRVIRQSSSFLGELEVLTSATKLKQDKIIWTEHLTEVFRSAQKALGSASPIRLPATDDQLILTHDGSQLGIGSILFVKRGEETGVGGYFSAKLKTHHKKWLPCEIEALSISSSVTHFGPLLRESGNVTQVLTDSRPCVQAWNKMIRGQFSTSARVATFFSTLSQYNIEMQHLSGDKNLPSDFLSRNPPECESKSCQICKFVDDMDDAAVRKVSVDDVLSGRCAVPYTNKVAWKSLQMECEDLRRVHAFLSAGTRPSAKKTKMTAVKRYLHNVIIGRDGLLVVRHSAPFRPKEDLIVIPQHVVLGLMMSLHLTFQHPTASQLLQIFKRSYFCLRAQALATNTTANCSLCQSLKTVPKELHSQSTVDYPETPCRSFAADIIRRFRQKIYALRDTFSSFTLAFLVHDETHASLRASLITSISTIRSSPQTCVVVRADNAPGFMALKDDPVLTKVNISIDLGRVHNKDKNPVIDKGISELISEILRLKPEGGQIDEIDLSLAVSQLNARIRGRGLTAWEILVQRDSVTGQRLDIDDEVLLQGQIDTRNGNQVSSAKFKARGGDLAMPAKVSVGSLVYVKNEGGKTQARDRYLVVRICGNDCVLKKLGSKFRNKEYSLKLTEVYPVTPNVLQDENVMRGMELSDEEETHVPLVVATDQEKQNDVPSSPSLGDSAMVATDVASEDPLEAAGPVGPDMDLTSDMDVVTDDRLEEIPVVIAEPDGVRRSDRARRKPRWTEQYDMD